MGILKKIGNMTFDVATSSDLIKIGGNVVSKIADRMGNKTDNANEDYQVGTQRAIPAAAPPPLPFPAFPTPPAVTQQGGIRYSDKLEAMIAMALENGGIDDYEMALLTKRAVKEGIDPDEFEFNLRMHLKKQNKQRDEIDNRSPVENLSMSLRMMEQYATGGERIVSPGDLSGALSLIPGVGQVAAVTGLLAAFIKTPSNLNNLKAEVIRSFSLPDNPEHLAQFISYAASQQEELIQQNGKLSIQGIVSSLSFGKDLDLYPIWEKKIEEACDKAKMQYFNDHHLMQVVKKYQPSLINKLKSGLLYGGHLDSIVPPSDDEELLQVIEFAYNSYDSYDDYDDYYYSWVGFYFKMYKEGEYRFANNPLMMSRLMKYHTSLIKKLKKGILKGDDLDDIVPPSDDEELFQVIEFAYDRYDVSSGWARFYSKMYQEGEYRFANNPQMMSRLIKYKRGLFNKGVSFLRKF